MAKIIPPDYGIYLGQYEWTAGDIATFEAAYGKSVSHFSSARGNWSLEYVSGHPHLALSNANIAWDTNKGLVVQCYNTYAGTDTEHPTGYTNDLLLSGTYDANLATLAADLRAFGRPVWFQCGREPNGVGQDYMGGFGTDGTQSLATAITNGTAYNQFTPPSPPAGAPSNLYSGCSGSSIPDGVGRVKAAQRYLYDFFVRRQGCTNLTFDSQGWNVRYYKDSVDNQDKYDSNDYVGHEAYALQVLQDCNFANFYPGDSYCDWPSLTFYTLDYYDANWSWLTGSDILYPTTDWINSLSVTYSQIQSVTKKPILLAECGFPDGMNSNTVRGASKLTDALGAILYQFPQIKAVNMWADHTSWFQNDIFPYNCLIAPGTTQATALQSLVSADPKMFNSKLKYSYPKRMWFVSQNILG